MKYVFIVNPHSGKREAEKEVIPYIHSYFEGKTLEYAVDVTEYPMHAAEIAAGYLKAEPKQKFRFFACGGDGTLNEVVTGAAGHTNTEIACFACGGGNDFIKCFDVPADNFRDVAKLVESESTPIDLLKVNDKYCINIVSVGLDADISNAVIKYRKAKFLRGPMAYNLALLECILKPIGKNLKIEIGDDIVLENKYVLAVAGNGNFYGGAYRATPEAKLDDGIIDIITVDKMSLPRVASMIPIYKKGEHLVDGRIIEKLADKLSYYRTDKIRISSDKDFIVNIDGERFSTGDMDVSLLKKAIRFVVPR